MTSDWNASVVDWPVLPSTSPERFWTALSLEYRGIWSMPGPVGSMEIHNLHAHHCEKPRE